MRAECLLQLWADVQREKEMLAQQQKQLPPETSPSNIHLFLQILSAYYETSTGAWKIVVNKTNMIPEITVTASQYVAIGHRWPFYFILINYS